MTRVATQLGHTGNDEAFLFYKSISSFRDDVRDEVVMMSMPAAVYAQGVTFQAFFCTRNGVVYVYIYFIVT